ncbi:MAG TPA: hypothetical protein VF665_21465 [Longimicrobium sp.]|jgi:hypothetical protein|uniref:hypothetical protein n=1 Tax=Longimicrobium sp. TaxID=2029185 RepID=UPI002ED9EC9E
MRTHLVVAPLLFIAGALAAQPGPGAAGGPAAAAAAKPSAPTSTAAADAFRVDIAVPEAPAFLLTGGDASGLLRPSTVRDFSAAFGDFTDKDGRFTLPSSFAVEIAPSLLFFGRNLTVAQYAGLPADIDNPLPRAPGTPAGAPLVYHRAPPANLFHRAWSTLRVSLATHRADGQDQPTKIALGLRTSPINDADPRLNTEYRRQIRSLLAARNELNTIIALRRCPAPATGGGPLIVPGLDTPAPVRDPKADSVAAAAAARLAECLTNSPDKLPAELTDLAARRNTAHAAIVEARKAFAERNWNQQTLEFAGAFSMAARDSTGRSPRPAEYAAWGTYTHPLREWAQFMVGGRFRSARDTATDERGSEWLVGSRLFMGRNTAKALLEVQLPFSSDLDARPYAGLGAEVRILPELWATFSTGLERQDDARPSRLVTRFSIRSGKPNLQSPDPTISQRTP